MKKITIFFAALLCCIVNVQLHAEDVYLYESNGIHYVLVVSTFGGTTARSAYVVHPEVTLNEEAPTPTTPSSYTGEIVVQDTIRYEGGDFPVKFVDENAFLQSTITSIDLPECITVFSSGAFKDCQQLQTIICRAQTPPSTRIHSIPWEYTDIFGSVDPDQVNVYVPDNMVATYQATGGWCAFTRIYPISKQSIDPLTANPSSLTRKILRNGNLIIENNGNTFNAQGQQRVFLLSF